MNKYIKKCLIIYLALTIVLVGMAFASYAITTTEADQYVTRSEYATDINRLQMMLDEQEALIIGNINKYRSTDVKFVTFDTPDKEYLATGNINGGHHNGGNLFPRRKTSSGSQMARAYGLYSTIYRRGVENCYTDIAIYRLWNGNYFITPSLAGKEGLNDDTATEYRLKIMCALPVEDLPGWYLVMGVHQQDYYYAQWNFSLVKLDPKVPMPDNATLAAMNTGTHRLRLKKNLWDYCGDYTTKLTTSESSTNASTEYFSDAEWMDPLSPSYLDRTSSTGSISILWRGYVEEKTGDYILMFKDIAPVSAYFGKRIYRYGGANCFLNRFIPADNVEYMMCPTTNSLNYRENYANQVTFPDSRYIGTGQADDPAWQYEFVDCVNGIKYWHGVRKATRVKLGSKSLSGFTYHYSLPIVY